MLSMYPEEQYAMRSLKLGASGYITKSADPEELLRAVEKIVKGGKYIPQSFQKNCFIILINLMIYLFMKNFQKESFRFCL